MAIVLIRTLLVYALLLVTMRLLGKRQLGEMELSEFVVAAVIADLAALPLQDIGIPMMNAVVPIVTLFCCEILIAGISMKSLRLRTLLFGRPSILISQGRILQSELRRNRFTLDELLQELRSQGIDDIRKVRTAVLETDGRLNVLLTAAAEPASAELLGIEVPEKGYPIVVINDGRTLSANLRHSGHDERWLEKQLKNHGLQSAEQVFLMTVNAFGEIYLAKKEGKP